MSHTVIDRFFDVLTSKGVQDALELVTSDAVFEAQGPEEVPIYGRFEGHEGVRRFVAMLGEMFDTEKFEIRSSVESQNCAFAFGYMQHRVRRTDRVFRSEWALYCEIRDGRISAYKMFEDTAALAAAYAT